jgi:hypothetical protein
MHNQKEEMVQRKEVGDSKSPLNYFPTPHHLCFSRAISELRAQLQPLLARPMFSTKIS